MTQSKIPLVILHGWGGSRASWNKCLQQIDRSKYSVHMLDLPGFGESGDPKKAWNVQDYAEHVKQWLKKEKLIKPVCVAHSFGGRIAIKLTSENSDLFSALFLVGAAGIKPKITLKKKLLKGLSALGKLVPGPFKKLARKILYKLAGAHDYNQTSGVMRETFQLVIDEDLTHLLKKIRTKTHIIWGEKDSYVPTSDAELMHHEIKGSTLKIIPEGKHGLHQQMPEKLLELITFYLHNDK